MQIVTNTPHLQRYAAEQTLSKLQGGSTHEAMVKVAGYILGEFGHLLQVPCTEYFTMLQQRFPSCSLQTKSLLLSAYAKLVTHTTDASFAEQVKTVFQRYHAYADVELQQRSVEYFAMAQYHEDKLKEVLAPMPAFPERSSSLERRAGGDAVDSSRALVQPAMAAKPATPGLIDFGMDELAPPRGGGGAAPPNAMNALDMLMDVAAPQRPGVGAAHPPAASGLDDLLGFGGAPTARPQPTVAASASVQPSLLHALALKDSGVLFEDACLQVGVKGEYRQSSGRLTLFLGNKHFAPLRLRADLRHVEGVRVALEAPLPQTLAEGQQATVQLTAVCAAPFATQPGLTIAYSSQSTQQEVVVNLPLPLFVTKFLAPAPPMDKNLFYQGWGRLTGPQKLETAVPLQTTQTMTSMLAGLQLPILPDIDPNPGNVFAACVLCTEAGQPLCVVRFEGGLKRLTVASPNPAVANAVQACILQLTN